MCTTRPRVGVRARRSEVNEWKVICGELVRERLFCPGLVIKASPNIDQGTSDGFSFCHPPVHLAYARVYLI